VIVFTGAQPSDDEVAAIVAALGAVEPPTHVAAPVPASSPWKMAGREYEPQSLPRACRWDDRCLARF
jgi:hypothetical protein